MQNVFDSIVGQLETAGVAYTLVEHAPVYTSQEASQIRGVPLEWGVKAMLMGGKRFFLVLIRADKKVDFRLFKEFEGSRIRLARPEEVLEETGCEIGSVPPFGHLKQLKTYLDRDVLKQENVTFNAGLHDKSVVMSGKDMLKVLKEPVLF